MIGNGNIGLHWLRIVVAAVLILVLPSRGGDTNVHTVTKACGSLVGSAVRQGTAKKLSRSGLVKSGSVMKMTDSDNVVPAGAPIVIRPLSRAVYQRDSNNLARITIAGTCDNGLDSIEARAIVRAGFKGTTTDWNTLVTNPDTIFSNSLEVTGGWYDIEVRTIRDGAPVSTSRIERVGVGEVFITCGQSNSANHGAPVQSPTDDRVNALNLKSMTWQLANDPQPYATGSGGSPWPDFGSLLCKRTETPVAIIAVGVGGTSVSQWTPGTGSYYPRISLAISSLKQYGGFRAILWHQGENDAGTGTEAATYAERLNSIIAQSRADAGTVVPWGVALVSWGSASTESNMAKVIAGQWLVITNTVGVFKGAATDTFHTLGWLSDFIHFNDLGLRDHGRQWVDAVWKSTLADDRDSDGMPDLWMFMHYGHATGETNDFSTALDDSDGDGVNNINEFYAHTDPTNPDECLRLSNISLSNGICRIAWSSVPGSTYQIRWTDVLTNEVWTGESSLLPAYESQMYYEMDATTDGSIQFYHVTVKE